jgi:hypothetical protein
VYVIAQLEFVVNAFVKSPSHTVFVSVPLAKLDVGNVSAHEFTFTVTFPHDLFVLQSCISYQALACHVNQLFGVKSIFQLLTVKVPHT